MLPNMLALAHGAAAPAGSRTHVEGGRVNAAIQHVPLPWSDLPVNIAARLKSENILTVQAWRRNRTKVFGITRRMREVIDAAVTAALRRGDRDAAH